MKLIDKETYKQIEAILLNPNEYEIFENVVRSLDELDKFFEGTLHYSFLKTYYYDRQKYKNRYKKEDLFKKIYRDLYIEEPTLYQIKKEVIYKAAMIFYKNGVL